MPENDSVLPDVQPWIENASTQAEELQRNLVDGTDSAIKSARVQIGQLYDASSEQIGFAQAAISAAAVEYKKYEDIFFGTLKEGVYAVQDNPNAAYGAAFVGAVLFFRTPRRFLWRNTLGRFQSTEQMMATADTRVKSLRQSVDLMKNESKKLEERAKSAEEELTRGRSKLKSTGSQLQSLVRSVYKTERQARGLMDDLREIPSRQALSLRAEVAAMAAEAKTQRTVIDKDVVRIANKYDINI